MPKVYVAQICTSEEIQAEEDDPSFSDNLTTPQFARVFADFGPAEISQLKQLAVVDLNDLGFYEPFLLADFEWNDSGWVRPENVRGYRIITGRSSDLDIFLTVQEVDLF